MESTLTRSLICGMAMAMSALAFGSADLHADGILIVKGMPVEGSRVIVVTKDGGEQVLTEGLSHFTLDMDFQKDYLVSFERPGCVSKQLRFNTYVPGEHRNPDGFRFPFQVTLEPLPDGQFMEYAGPVGYIHFDEKLVDFTYSTDYRMLKDDFLTEELEKVQAQFSSHIQPVLSSTPVLSKLETETAETRTINTGAVAKPLRMEEVIAPVVSRTPPMVHLLASEAKPAVPVVIITDHAPEPVVVEDAPDAPVVPMVHKVDPGTQQTKAMEVARLEKVESQAPEMTAAMEKEVQVDPLHVITIIRFRKGSDTDEYRRVVSYYGGTTYFCNGYACSADTYQKQINR